MRAATPTSDREALRDHLLRTGLAGAVQTSPANTWANIERLVAGDPETAFGLDVGADATPGEVADAVASVCGADPRQAAGGPSAAGWIDPAATLAGLERHSERLALVAAQRAPVLLATGHPTGLLPHYMAIARELQVAGCTLLAPLDGQAFDSAEGARREVRYLDGVACVSDGGSLRHTHRDDAMRAMLARLAADRQRPELVVADHGFAGAAIASELPTAAIADVNDVALPLAQMRGLTDAVLPLDDNLPPRVMIPVTRWLLERVATALEGRRWR